MRQFTNNKNVWVCCFIYSLLIQNVNKVNGDDDDNGWWGYTKTAAKVGGAVAGGVAFVAGAPVVLGALGFTSAGIAGGSIAAGMQGSAIAGGSAFAIFQSLGAGGLGLAAKALVGTGGAYVGEKIVSAVTKEKDEEKCEK